MKSYPDFGPRFCDREPPVSVVQMAQQELREQPVRPVSPVLLAHLDPR